jgi:galactose-1-phosphate uridylyltransferase
MGMALEFKTRTATARIVAPDGRVVDRPVEIRTNPVTGRTSRITRSRGLEREPGTERLPGPPPDSQATDTCPFCHPQLERQTPQLVATLVAGGRLVRGESVLFPNLFPYAAYSAVSTFDRRHYVEIGTAAPSTYCDSLLNCRRYLRRVIAQDPAARYMAITQNHLPSAGGSLLHPHLQVHADRVAANHLRFLEARAGTYLQTTGRRLFGDYLAREKAEGRRMIGRCGRWQWLAAFAPEGFYELWALLPEVTSLFAVSDSDWSDLARGIIQAQKFYRAINRNGYNLGLLAVEKEDSALDLRLVMLARANYAPWVRNDHTGFEVMLGDMATFSPPEETARQARVFWG